MVNPGIDVVVLHGGEKEEQRREKKIEDFHFREWGNSGLSGTQGKVACGGMTRKILFVCTGNTCRSPMAEGIFRKASRGGEFEVASAGVAARPGSVASAETVAVLAGQGIDLGDFRSRMVDEQMLEEAEAVFCMTEGHLEMLEMMHPEYEEKYHLACDFVELNGKVGADVPDPIGMGRPAYETTSRVLNEAIGGILGFLEERSGG